MDERNGEVFDHHAELFAQIGNIADNDSLRDFVLNSSDMIETSRNVKNTTLPRSQSSGTIQSNIWDQEFNGCSKSSSLVINHNRSAFNSPGAVLHAEPPANEVVKTNILPNNLETRLRGASHSEAVIDQYSPSELNKNVCLSTIVDNLDQITNPHFSNLHQTNLERVTTEKNFLDNFNRLENDMLGKCTDFENLAWNGLICDTINNINFKSQSRLTHSLQSSIDKNGNSALFGSSHVDKIGCSSNPTETLIQNNFMARLSPSASVETSVRTPATSYESASPLSSNRTPIRSDESISPMGSGHTPLRVEESTSPLTNIKTPIQAEDGSPMARTPFQVEDSFSPAGNCSSILASDSPSHKGNGPMSVSDNYSSSTIFKKTDVLSLSDINLLSYKQETAKGGCKKENEQVAIDSKSLEGRVLKTGEVCSNNDKKEGRKTFQENCFLVSPDSSLSSEALIKQQTIKKLPIPFVSAKRIDDPIMEKKSTNRTLFRKSDGELFLGSSLLPEKSEIDIKSMVTDETRGVKTENLNVVPEISKITQIDDAQKRSHAKDVSFSEKNFSKSKKRRKKSDSLCLPSIKRRSRSKRVTIYQSTMSPEEAGIKLKITLASTFQPIKSQKKRRSRNFFGSDEEDESGSKRTKKNVRFTETSGQTKWGNEIPPDILQKIFQIVVEEQGCVPSLIRFSSVCKLWNTVANRSELWQNIDLSSPYIKQKCKIDRYFRWLLENRLENIRELNLSGWKFANITMVLSLIGTHCTDIESIGLAGWQGLHYEHLKSLLQDCPRLGKLDLSDVSPESKSANSAVSQKSITFLTQTMGERLTQLILAHNTLTCLPQIISNLATHCPNLQILDLSNIRRASNTEFALNIEHLQEGCPNLKVLRITNSCITLANVPLEKQVASPGFINLEELSIASHQGTESLRITSVMDDSCLERILKTSNKLKLLDVRGCTRVTDSSLVRVPAWDIQHLFLSGCYVTRQSGSGLELIAQKWCHSLVEVDLAWTTVTEDLHAALMAFVEKGSDSPLRVMNLCGSSVTLEPVKALLSKCNKLESLNLQSCRGLPRGVKRLYENEQLIELRNLLEKKDRDSASESEDKGESECEGKSKDTLYSTNKKNDDLVT